MTTESDALELLADLRALFQANPNDTRGMDELRRLVQELDGAPEPRPIQLHTWVGQAEPEPRRWLVDSWLPAGRVALITGPGGVGKSRLILQLAAGIASGGDGKAWIGAPRDVLSLGAGVEGEGSPVVYASWEDEPEEVWRRLSAISGQTAAPWVTPERLARLHIADMAGHGPIWAPSSGSRHISAMATITEAGQELRRHCEQLGARLLVLDPLAAAYAGDENARGLVRAFVSDWDAWGRACECAVCLVAHPPKSGSFYAGSTDWQGAVRSMWALDKAQRGKEPKGEDNRPFEWRLSCEKSNYGLKPESLHLDWDAAGDNLRWKIVGAWDTGAAASTNGRNSAYI